MCFFAEIQIFAVTHAQKKVEQMECLQIAQEFGKVLVRKKKLDKQIYLFTAGKGLIYGKKNTGKKLVAQGKLRENTGNFISAGMWPPCRGKVGGTPPESGLRDTQPPSSRHGLELGTPLPQTWIREYPLSVNRQTSVKNNIPEYFGIRR